MTTYFVIVNPTSGRGAGKAVIPALRELLDAHGLRYQLVETERPWHAAELARQAAAQGVDVVVAVGGDGTSNEVINGLMLARQAGEGQGALGVISVGRGNDFAFGAGIPAEMKDAVQALAADQRAWMDIGKVSGGDYPDGRFFGNGVGIGFDAVVGFEALKMKRLHGFASYMVAALKTIFLYYTPPRVKVTYDGQSLETHTLMVSIMNGRRMGGGFHMAPEAAMDDSLFDICLAEKVSRPRIFALIPRFMQGNQASHPAIKTMRAQSIAVQALQGSLPAHGDGETICLAGDRLFMEILPQQIEIVTPGLPGSKVHA